MNYNIIPQIKNITILEKEIRMSDFKLNHSIIELVPIAEKVLLEGTYTGNGDRQITFVKGELNKKDSYKITISEDAITIYSDDLGGVLYAVYTLSELDILNNGILQECIIEDEPHMGYRAISDDISRGQISTYENFQQIIRTLSRYKYNVYMPYIEDVFKFECCQEWGKYSDGLTADEWKSLSEYAKQYNISVRPVINLLGHFDKNTALKELQKLTIRKEDGSYTSVIDPLNEKVRPLISKILDEVVYAFGEGAIHVGGDEPCELTEVYGKEKGSQLFNDHYTWISSELKKRGCTMMMYADFFAPPWGDYSVGLEKALDIPEGTNFVFWDYGPRERYPYVEKLTEMGLEVTVSPGTWTWNRFTSDIKVCWDNTKGLLNSANGRCNHMIMSSWGDGGDCSRELTWPGVLIGANFAWNNTSTYDFKEFYYIYHESFFGINREESDKLLNVYHYDRVIELEDNFIFKLEIYKNPLEPIKFEAKDKAHLLIDEMDKAIKNMSEIRPLRNLHAFDALLLGVKRIKFTAEKLAYLPHSVLRTREDAMSYIDKVNYLAGEIEKIRAYHEKVWFATNRNSDWGYVDCLYQDLRDQLQSMSRRLRYFKKFN